MKMKTMKIYLFLVLILTLGASLNAMGAWDGEPCTTWRDCYNQVREGTGKYCNGTTQILENWTHFPRCDAGTGFRCLDVPGPIQYWVTCDKKAGTDAINTTCSNGGTYTFKNTCDYGACRAYDIKPGLAPSAGCDRCTACKAAATRMGSNLSSTTYDIGFDNEYTIDNGIYILTPNSTMDMDSISSVRFLCGNSGPFNQSSNLVVWVYNAINNTKLGVGFNDIEVDSTLNRSNVIGDSSDTCGTHISNVFTSVIGTNGTPVRKTDRITNIYTFAQPTNYTVFIDIITAYCTPVDADHRPIAQNYVCPWLGGTARANICIGSDNNSADGWAAKENVSVLVPDPDITIAAPSSEANLNVTTIQKTWAINNTGVGRITMNITYDCGNWSCAFEGYTAGSPMPLEEKESRDIKLNITINSPDVNHLVGILIKYDEGYGLSTIPPKNKTSYITITNTNVTTTTLQGSYIT
jgi:hypothetical protein